MKDEAGIIVVGGGGHAQVVIDGILALGERPTCVLDDESGLIGSQVLGIEVTEATEYLYEVPGRHAILAIGSNRKRQELAIRYEKISWTTVVHPRAYVHPSVQLGPGSVVCAGAIVQPNAILGAHSIINTGATVDHDCVVGAYAHVAPGSHLAGNVELGEGVLFGIGASAIPGVTVGGWSIVGAGAAVTQDLPSHVTAVGVPARIIKKHTTR